MESAVVSDPAVDVHTHLAPKLDQARFGDASFVNDQAGRLVLDGKVVGPPSLYAPSDLLDYLEAHALDQAFVSVPPPFFRQHLPSQENSAWVSAINAGIIDACGGDSRLRPMVYVPFDNPVRAVREIRKYLANNDIAGWSIAAGGGSGALDAPEFAEAWNLLDADGRPVVLHPGTSPDTRLARHYLHNLLGNPVETSIAVAELVFGGVLVGRENLRLVLVHCGGVVPVVAARWQRGIDTGRPGVDVTLPSVSSMLQQFYTDCLTHDPAAVDLARTVFGDDGLLLGSDWPFSMGLDDPREPIKHLAPNLQEQIARSNPRRLISLDRSSPGTSSVNHLAETSR